MSVFGSDPTVMTFDDRLGDRKAKPRMAPKVLALRSDAMKTVKNSLSRRFRNARALILNTDDHVVPGAGSGNFDQSIAGGEGNGIVDDIVEHSRNPRFISHDDGGSS